jgi:hypothetical protein
MANMFKPSSSTQSQTSRVEPYTGWTKDWIQPGLNLIQNNLGKPGEAYKGQLTTGWTGGQEDALNSAKSYFSPNSITGRVASGNFLDYTKNPLYDIQRQNLNQSMGSAVNSLNTKFSPWMSSTMRNNAAGNLMKQWGKGEAEIGANLWNQEINRATSAQQQMANLGSQYLGLESQKQANQQTGLDANYKEWLRQQGVGEQSVNTFLQAMALLRSPEQTTEGTTSQRSTFLGK